MNTITTDFKTFGSEDRGRYYPDSQRLLVYISNHESLADIFKTIDHELFHHCIHQCDEEMDEDQEERLVFYLAWAEEYLA